MRVSTAFNTLLALPGVNVTDVEFTADRVVVDARLRRRRLACPRCDYTTAGRHNLQRQSSSWRALDLGVWRVTVRARLRRLSCPEHGVVVEEVPFARHGARVTRDVDDLVAWLATKTDKTAITRLLRINWRTVGAIIERVVTDELDPHRLDGLYEVGIDEVSYRKQHHYLTELKIPALAVAVGLIVESSSLRNKCRRCSADECEPPVALGYRLPPACAVAARKTEERAGMIQGRRFSIARRQLAALAALVALLAACGGPDETGTAADDSGADAGATQHVGGAGSAEAVAGALTSITVAPGSPSFVSQAYYYIAKELGFFEEEGLSVEIISNFEGGQPEIAMVEGELDIVAESPARFLERMAQDPDHPSICTATVGLWPFRVMVPTDSPLEEATDLAGTTVGLPEQSDIDTLGYMLGVAGVDPSQVETAAVGGRAPAAIEMAAGRIDAFMGTHVDQLAIETDGDLPVRIIETVPPTSTFNTCVLTTTGTLEQRPEVVEGFLRGLAKGFTIQHENPELAVDLLGQARPEAYDNAADALALMMATNEVNGGTYEEQWEYPVEEWQDMVDSFAEAGAIEESFDISSNIDLSLLDAVWDFDKEAVLEQAEAAAG